MELWAKIIKLRRNGNWGIERGCRTKKNARGEWDEFDQGDKGLKHMDVDVLIKGDVFERQMKPNFKRRILELRNSNYRILIEFVILDEQWFFSNFEKPEYENRVYLSLHLFDSRFHFPLHPFLLMCRMSITLLLDCWWGMLGGHW